MGGTTTNLSCLCNLVSINFTFGNLVKQFWNLLEAFIMEAFQLLSTGGVKFNKTKYENDVRLFSVRLISHLPLRIDLSCDPECQIYEHQFTQH